ncbi:MAG: bifunctional riboflavin kinase/FAD synthetase [Anaeroplasmataceae bacterium]
MEIINIKNLNPIDMNFDICAAVGNFDGVHLGHQKLIEECKKQGLKSAVLTFYPHPNTFIRDLPNYELLSPLDLKIKLMEREELDYLIIVEFSEEISMVDKDVFVDFMKKMRIVKVVCGYDFTFGYKALGTTQTLIENFDTIVVPKYIKNDVRISTTHIKDLLRQGEIHKASSFLGRNHVVVGKVMHGNSIGNSIGFPTANIDYHNALLPKNGVYFVRAYIDNNKYYGMANIGYNPTINYSIERKLEVNIFDLKENLYNKEVFIEIIERIRPEKKYDSKESLIAQLHKDKEFCLNLISKIEKN